MEDKKINVAHSRFSSADWYDKELPTVIIGGVGGIGSWLSLFLSKLGFDLVLYDMDTVETVNIGSQFYGTKDLSKPKTLQTKENCTLFSSDTNILLKGEYVEASYSSNIMCACFDNMKARKLMYENWKKYEDPKKIFVDGRMLAEQFEVYFVTPGREEEYEKTVFSDSEVDPVPCSYKSTVHFGAGIAYEIVKGITNHLSNLALEDVIKEVPFSIHTYGANFLNEIKNA